MWGTRFSALSTTSCVWSRFIANAVGSCNAVGHMWVGGIPFLASGDLPKNAFSSSEQHRYKQPRVKCAIFKSDMVLEKMGCEEVGYIMAGSWKSSVVVSQQVKSWTALWLDHGRVQWEVKPSEKLDCIMVRSWQSSVGGPQQVESWTALWLDHGSVQWEVQSK